MIASGWWKGEMGFSIIHLKSQLSKMSHFRDLLYNMIPIVNDTASFTSKMRAKYYSQAQLLKIKNKKNKRNLTKVMIWYFYQNHFLKMSIFTEKHTKSIVFRTTL